MSVVLFGPDGRQVVLPAGLTLDWDWHSWAAVGGPDEMDVTVQATEDAAWEPARWLGWKIHARNELGSLVWWGYIDEVEITRPGYRVGLSLREMSNRVQVLYTYEDAAGALVDAETEWAEHAQSVARYGVQELRHTMSDTTAEAAEALRDRILAGRGVPHGVPSARGGTPGATLRCRGRWSTLARKYWQQVAGKEGHETTGNASQALGVGKTAATIGFREEPRRIFDVDEGFLTGSKVVVSGSTSNDGTYEVASLSVQEDWTVVSTEITFAAQDDLTITGTGFAGLAVGDIIQVQGSALNDGIYEIGSLENDNHLEVREKGIVAEAAGATVTISRRSYLSTVENLVEEDAGATVTLTGYGVKVGQGFGLAEDADWTAAEVAVRVKRVGTPTDDLKIELCAAGGGVPGTVLDSGTVDGENDIATTMGWVVVPLSNTALLEFGETYWIVLSRTGANDASNFYVVDFDENSEYVHGERIWTGSAWVARDPDGDIPFVVWGKAETTQQLADIIEEAGEFLTAAEISDASGIETRQWRAGELTALDEAEKLLEIGDSSGGRLLATVTPEERVVIFARPAADERTDWRVRADGQIVSSLGEPIEPGRTPAGRWLRLTDAPAYVDDVAPLSPVFVERATARADGTVEWEPEGVPSPWELARVQQG